MTNNSEFAQVIAETFGIDLNMHGFILNYNVRNVEDFHNFMDNYSERTPNIVRNIIALKVDNQKAHDITIDQFKSNVANEGKAAVEQLMCEYILDRDYEELKKYSSEVIYEKWSKDHCHSVRSLYKGVNQPEQMNNKDVYAQFNALISV